MLSLHIRSILTVLMKWDSLCTSRYSKNSILFLEYLEVHGLTNASGTGSSVLWALSPRHWIQIYTFHPRSNVWSGQPEKHFLGKTTPNAAESTKFPLPFIAGDSNPTTDNTELQRLRYSGRSRHAEEGSNANSSKADIEVGRFLLQYLR